MTRIRSLLLAATLLAPVPALAVIDPVPGPRDSRVRSTPYDAQQVVRLTSTGLVPLQVVLEAGEKAVMIAGAMVQVIGDDGKIPETRDWLAKRSGNVLVLQPLRQMEPSMLFVRSLAADGRERPYSFELRTRDGKITDASDHDAYMTVEFAYKHVPTPDEIAAWRARRDALVAARGDQAVQARFAQAQLGFVNANYDKRDPVGCPLLAPVSINGQPAISDDGHRTTLTFAPHTVLPEVYVINQDNKKANTTTINETTADELRVIVPSVQRGLVLLRGGKVCAIRNNAFDTVGTQPGGGTGTISPDVVRQVRQVGTR